MREKKLKKDIEDLMTPPIDHLSSLKIGGVRYQQAQGPKEDDKTGEVMTRSMIGDHKLMMAGIRAKDRRKRREKRKR